jgi:hypothetical protein
MRLPDAEIKQGILHPDQMVRDAALCYFAEPGSEDPAVMPLAIQAVEAHGWEKAFRFAYRLADLAQTDETIGWLIDRLNREGYPRTDDEIELCSSLSSILAKADVHLLMRHEEKILALEGMSSQARDVVADRLRLLTLDTAACWEALDDFCEKNKGKQYINEVDLPRAHRLAEAIARDEASAERVLSLLAQKVEDFQNNPMRWMEGVAIHLAGLMRLEAAVPMLIAKLMADSGDDSNEECQAAFPKIGTDATVDAIAKEFPSAPWHFRLYASTSLGRIHTDRAMSICQELLAKEEDGQVRVNLMAGLLGSFCAEGIEPARKLTLTGSNELRGELVAAATLLGAIFPELETWREKEKKHNEEMDRRGKLLMGRPKEQPKAKAPSFDKLVAPAPLPPIVGRKKAGRNDPCPCGSGKKYKKCCMGKA